jgi:hypothetical protein
MIVVASCCSVPTAGLATGSDPSGGVQSSVQMARLTSM